MSTHELGFISVPISPTFVGIAGKLNAQLIKPAQEAGRKAATEVEKSVEASVKGLERQVSASTKKLAQLDRAHQDSVQKRELQQQKLNTAIAEQTAAEEKYQAALKKGGSGVAEYAKLEKAKAKVTDETIKLTKAERDITDAEQKHKAQLDDLQRTTEKFGKAQADLNNEVGKSKGVFGGLRDSFKDLGGQVSSMPGPIGSIGETLSSFKGGPAAGVLAVSGALMTAAGAAGKFNEDLSKSRVSMQNQFGLSADAARDMQGEIAEALGSGLGGYEETAMAVTQIAQVLGDDVAHMGGLTAAQLADDFMAFNQTFERSAEETASTVDVMLNSGLVGSAQEGIDLLTAGMQKVPLAMQDEVFDAMNEYSKYFSNMGIDGAQAMSMLVDASGDGQYAIDKLGDSVKELSLNAIDPAKVETLAEMGVQVEDFAGKVARGGPEAGQAMRDLAEQLLAIEDPGKRAEAAIVAFGTPIEDLGIDQIPSFLESLTAGSDGMADFDGSAQEMADNTTSTFTGMFDSLKGRVHGWAIDTTLALNEWAGEAADAVVNSDFVERVGGMFDEVKELGSGVKDILFEGDYTGLPFGLSEDSGVVDFLFNIRESVTETRDDVIAAWDELTAAFTGGDWGYGALSELIGEEKAKELVDMLAEWGEKVQEFKDNVTEGFSDIWSVMEPVFTWLQEFASEHLSGALEDLWGALQSVGSAFLEIATSVGGALWDALMGAWELFQALWDLLSPILMPLLQVVAAIVGGVLVAAFLGLVGAIRVAAEIIEDIASVISWLAENVLGPLIGLVGEVARVFAEILANAVTSLRDRFIESFAAVSEIWDGFTTLLEIGKDIIVATVFGGIGAGLDVIKGHFQTAVDAIGQIWSGLISLTAQPAKFIVETVYGGIRGAWNKVADWVDLPELPEVKLGDLGNYAQGTARVPGARTRYDNVHMVSQDGGWGISLRGGEGVLVPEVVDGLGEDAVNALNHAGLHGGKRAVDRVLHAMNLGGFDRGGFVDFGGFNLGGVTNLAGSLSAIQRSHAQFVGKFFPDLFNLTSAGRNEPGSFHDFGSMGATDWQAKDGQFATQMPTRGSKALAKAIFTNFGNSAELIHHPLDGWQNVNDGAPYDYGPATNAAHGNHVHWATRNPLKFDGDSIVLDDAGGGFFESIASMVKKLWDPLIAKIPTFDGAGTIGELPGAFLGKVADAAWNHIKGLAEKLGFGGGGGGGAEQWRGLASQALKRMGYGDEYLDAMLQQIEIESTGDPNAQNNWDSNALRGTPSRGLLQVIDPTYRDVRNRYPDAFEGLPDDPTHPLTNLVAGVGAVKRDWGGPGGRWPTKDGYSEGGIVDLAKHMGATKFDVGGLWPSGTIGVNMSGEDEFVLKHSGMRSLGDLARAVGDLVPAIKVQAEATARFADSAEEWLVKAADSQSEEGITARQSLRRILDLGIDLPGAGIITGVLDAEEDLWASRTRHLGHLESLAEKEKALEEARKALNDLESSEGGLSTQDQRKLDDAQKAVDEAKANLDKADSEEKRASATEKLADAEEKLRRVREDLDENATENAEKHAGDITKANEQVAQAEADLVEAKKQQVMDLDHITLVTQDSILGMIPQAEGLASQIIGMGAPVAAVNQGLGAVIGSLTQVAGLAGPAGITLGMAFDAVKIGIQLITTVVNVIKDIIDRINKARLAAHQAMADGWKVVAEYAGLVVEMQENVASLQQEIIRGLNEQRVAEFQLRVAQQDRMVAEAEGILAVAEARMALDREIERGNIAAQLRLMGLHEDWDSYMSFQALASAGMLDAWSDSAIGALFTYEAARAKALQAELGARVAQINAEANLAQATRQNLRNQQDLLKAQERLIRMSAEVAGVDFVEATATAQVADLVVKMAELQQNMDANWLGKAGSFLGTSGPWSNEYRGQQAQMASYEAALQAIFEETGVSLSDSQLSQAIDQMKWVSGTGGDPMAVLRQLFPELVDAETALLVNDALGPIWDAQDRLDQMERDAEDFAGEIDLFDKVQPLEETIAGLDYTIAGLEQAANAWADGNEELRAEYLGAAWANYQAAKALGVDWQLDSTYATPGVRDQIVKEVNVYMNGNEVYTADQVDQLLAEVTSGSNVRVTTSVSASTVATTHRGVMA